MEYLIICIVLCLVWIVTLHARLNNAADYCEDLSRRLVRMEHTLGETEAGRPQVPELLRLSVEEQDSRTAPVGALAGKRWQPNSDLPG